MLATVTLVVGVPVGEQFDWWDFLPPTLLGKILWALPVLFVLILGTQAVYEKRRELERLHDAARSSARLTPQQRERVQQVKELGSRVVSHLNRPADPISDTTGDRKAMDVAWLLTKIEDRTATMQARYLAVVALAANQFREDALFALEPLWGTPEAAISRARRAFDVLDAACNSVLEKFPDTPGI